MVKVSPSPAAANTYPNTRDIGTAERMDILSQPGGPGFLPVTKREVDTAFLRWLHRTHDDEPFNVTLEKIFYDQLMTVNGKPQEAVLAVAGEAAAYALQANRDYHVLLRRGKDLKENPIDDASSMTAAQLLRGVPAHDGPGQIVRFLDLGRIADGATPDNFDFNPLGGEVKKGKISGTWGVVEPYTVVSPDPKVSRHIGEVLDGILASDLMNIYEGAVNDQEGRLRFWGDVMVEAHREDLARPIARAALRAPGMAAFYPEYSQE
ncbi:MAG TPA: hypothetical protein VHD60_03300 [Candidatus Saccharimonadales bacterium]|nr:hypothetical protein [Candidatus Saccharimonadales bacterium]